jgi:hypothetical protein
LWKKNTMTLKERAIAKGDAGGADHQIRAHDEAGRSDPADLRVSLESFFPVIWNLDLFQDELPL